MGSIRKAIQSSASAVLFGFLAAQANAAMTQFNFAGQITDDAINGCGGLVNCGVVSGSYSFDNAAADGNASVDAGLYGATSISFLIDGSLFFSATSGLINVANFAMVNQYGLLVLGGSADNGSSADLSILLEDTTAAAFSSDALPATPAALALLLPGDFTLFAGDDSFQLQGVIDSVTCTSGCGGGTAPEPATALLLAAGLAAIGRWRRRLGY